MYHNLVSSYVGKCSGKLYYCSQIFEAPPQGRNYISLTHRHHTWSYDLPWPVKLNKWYMSLLSINFKSQCVVHHFFSPVPWKSEKCRWSHHHPCFSYYTKVWKCSLSVINSTSRNKPFCNKQLRFWDPLLLQYNRTPQVLPTPSPQEYFTLGPMTKPFPKQTQRRFLHLVCVFSSGRNISFQQMNFRFGTRLKAFGVSWCFCFW